jgi:predicted thioesterase
VSGQLKVGMVREITVKTEKEHTAATPLGMEVRVKTEVTAVDGAKLTFKLEAWDEVEKIGEAIHERFIIKPEKFISRLAKKTAK